MFGLSDNSDKNSDAQQTNDSHDPMGYAGPPAPQDSGMPAPSSGGLDSPSAMPPQPVPPPPITQNNNDSAAPSANNAVADSQGSVPSQSMPTAPNATNNANEDQLVKLKQQALQNLAPLVDHLDQTAEEKFKTTMMLIQASDNAELIPEAYEAANKITDEKIRAQALLDVVNEINYFTHQPPQEKES